jgi:hypothetical protein
MATSDSPCARCKTEPRHSSYRNYCLSCGRYRNRRNARKRRGADPDGEPKKRSEYERRGPEAHRRAYARDLHERYGIDVETFARMFDAQGRACKICGVELELGRNVHLDHCHATKIVRGILCNRCNLMIGLARDNPLTLRAAAAYLGVPP